MLLSSLAVHDLLRELAEVCDNPLTVEYAEEVPLAGPFPEIFKAVRFLQTAGPGTSS